MLAEFCIAGWILSKISDISSYNSTKELENAKRNAWRVSVGLKPKNKKPIFKTHSKLKIFLICFTILFIITRFINY